MQPRVYASRLVLEVAGDKTPHGNVDMWTKQTDSLTVKGMFYAWPFGGGGTPLK